MWHLEKHGCVLKREGSSHFVFINPALRTVSAVPRHTEVKGPTALKICRDLEIPALVNVKNLFSSEANSHQLAAKS